MHSNFLSELLQAVFVSLDHLLDHLAADAAGLTRGDVTVVALLEVHANFGSRLHLKAVHRVTSVGVEKVVAVLGHFDSLLYCFGNCPCDSVCSV